MDRPTNNSKPNYFYKNHANLQFSAKQQQNISQKLGHWNFTLICSIQFKIVSKHLYQVSLVILQIYSNQLILRMNFFISRFRLASPRETFTEPVMFANIFMLSLLTIIYGTKGDEGGGNVVERNFLPQLSQQRSSDGDCKYLLIVTISFVYVMRCFFASRLELAEIYKNAV